MESGVEPVLAVINDPYILGANIVLMALRILFEILTSRRQRAKDKANEKMKEK